MVATYKSPPLCQKWLAPPSVTVSNRSPRSSRTAPPRVPPYTVPPQASRLAVIPPEAQLLEVWLQVASLQNVETSSVSGSKVKSMVLLEAGS